MRAQRSGTSAKKEDYSAAPAFSDPLINSPAIGKIVCDQGGIIPVRS